MVGCGSFFVRSINNHSKWQVYHHENSMVQTTSQVSESHCLNLEHGRLSGVVFWLLVCCSFTVLSKPDDQGFTYPQKLLMPNLLAMVRNCFSLGMFKPSMPWAIHYWLSTIFLFMLSPCHHQLVRKLPCRKLKSGRLQSHVI